MTTATRAHIIQRQRFELIVPSEAAARRVHDEVRRLQGSVLADVLDRCCSAASEPEAIYRISTLEVDLGQVDPSDFEHDLVRRLMDRLPAALERALPVERRTANARLSARDGDVAPPKGEINGVDDNAAPEPADVAHLVELIAVFARTGTLPWWTDVRQPPDLKESVHQLLVAAPAELVRMLREIAVTRSHLERFVGAIDDELLAAVGDLVTPEAASSLPLGELATLFLSVPAWATSTRRTRDMWVLLLRVALEGAHLSSIAVVNAAVARVAHATDIPTALIASELLDAAVSLQASPRTMAVIQECDEVNRRYEHGRPTRAAVSEKGESFSARTDRRSFAGPAKPDAPSGDSESALERTEARGAADVPATPRIDVPPAAASLDLSFSESDHVYVDNAGLVMVAPFLDTFFTRLGLMREAQFGSSEQKHRAVGLLQYLATGDTTPLEQSVPLNKVLCGLEIFDVFDFGEPVTDREAQECTDLLAAVIEHAAVFGDISTAGLQGTFLRRLGALSAEPGSWVLRVERATHDIVLDRLPWSLDWVTLPWMSAPLGVEW